ncbi:LytR/AlgR family response regulator transcription factor [Taibaiella koreensis]|uniref:LytR/AlgR family response regulator transcription factor n=1 Tax=Taibaiella koreensis TaxID=1268548 RepID=UPI000E59BF00|nr:LytTR family DNA-binding domain-containing protein [Taibaiella koreensis]
MTNKGIYIVEDEPLHLDHLLMLLEELGYGIAGSQQEPFAAMADIERLKPGVVLMDIDLQGRNNGIMLASQLQRLQPDTRIIFTTAQINNKVIEEALSAVAAKSYLVKPIGKAALQAALLLALTPAAPVAELKTEQDHVFVRTGSKLRRIALADITYLEADVKNYVTLHTIQREKASVRLSLTELMTRIPAGGVLQIHRTYAVNFRYVETINEKEQCLLANGVWLPIGKTFKKQVYERLNLL